MRSESHLQFPTSTCVGQAGRHGRFVTLSAGDIVLVGSVFCDENPPEDLRAFQAVLVLDAAR